MKRKDWRGRWLRATLDRYREWSSSATYRYGVHADIREAISVNLSVCGTAGLDDDVVAHRLLAALAAQTNTKGVSRRSGEEAARASELPLSEIRDVLADLENAGHIELVHNSGLVKILVHTRCPHHFSLNEDKVPGQSGFLTKNPPRVSLARSTGWLTSPLRQQLCEQEEPQLRRREQTALDGVPTKYNSTGGFFHSEYIQKSVGKKPSAKNLDSEYYLTFSFFPRICKEYGLRGVEGHPAIIRALKCWGYNANQIRWMMEEFAKNGDAWIHRSSAWKVFLVKRSELERRLQEHERKERRSQPKPVGSSIGLQAKYRRELLGMDA